MLIIPLWRMLSMLIYVIQYVLCLQSSVNMKEEYMTPLYSMILDRDHVQGIRRVRCQDHFHSFYSGST